jgi:O-antigen/teichoic acid export membrane protein
MGNGIYILCQWGTLVAIARLTNPAALGMFGLALALTAPMVLLFDLQLRAAYVTDVAESHPFADYFIIRSASVCLVLGSSLLLGFLMTPDPLARLVIFGVGLSKAIESGDDLINGLFQKAERFDLLAKSRIAKGVASLVAAAGILFWTRNVAAASFTIGLVWLVTAAFVAAFWAPSFARSCRNLRNRVDLRRLCGLVCSTFPLGVAQALITFQASLPRIVLQRIRGFEEVGIYTAISSLLVAGTAVMTAVGLAVMPRMAMLFALNRHEEVRRMRTRLVIGAAAVGSVSVLFAWTAGSRVLALLFGAGFSIGAHALVVLMVAMTVTFIASINDFILVAQRRFSSQIAIHIMSTAVSAVGCVLLISPYGLIGGAMAVLLGAFVRVLANSVLLKRSVECHREAPPLHPMLSQTTIP